MATIPPRNRRALRLLALEGDEDIVEIGCGSGAAIEALGRAGHKGLITAIDHSGTAVQRAGRRNQQLVDRGRLTLLRMSSDQFLDDQNPLSTRLFDRVFSVNVNRFWTHPVAAETRAILRLLKPAGIFLCFYEAPSIESAGKILPKLGELLDDLHAEGQIVTDQKYAWLIIRAPE